MSLCGVGGWPGGGDESCAGMLAPPLHYEHAYSLAFHLAQLQHLPQSCGRKTGTSGLGCCLAELLLPYGADAA